ncbi:methyltransferase domain-containing protein [Candidatus Pacearchaeota archaeon]|nr:methyltransferase domain-containing protein [Candidatus Pacearchaeota archaeon]
MGYAQDFAKDCDYYDPNRKELNCILRNSKFKGKIIADIGSGIGRLSYPLSRYAKRVYAIDSDKRLINYANKIFKKNNLILINKKFEDFIKRNKEKIDIFLLSWPWYSKRLLRIIKHNLDNGEFIVIINDDNSEFGKLYNKLINWKETKKRKREKIKQDFILSLKREFLVKKFKKISLSYLYPNKREAINNILWNLKTWFNINGNRSQISNILEKYRRRDAKIEIPEKVIYFKLKKK